jgi:hypothetical protein
MSGTADRVDRRSPVRTPPLIPSQNDERVKIWGAVELPFFKELLEDAGIVATDMDYRDMMIGGKVRLAFDAPEVREKLHQVFRLYSKAQKIKWSATKKLAEITDLKADIEKDIEKYPGKEEEFQRDIENLEYAEYLCDKGLQRDLYDIYAMFREQFDKMRVAGHMEASDNLRIRARSEDSEELILRRKSIREFEEDGVL